MAAQALSVFPITPSSSAKNQSCRKPSDQFVGFSLSNSFVGTRLRLQSSTPGLIASKRHRSPVATVSFSLPTSKTGLASNEKAKWSSKAIKSFAMAELEARKLKYPTTGTEALLMGILIEGTNLAAKYLRANGITLSKVRDESVKLLGKSDIFFFSPEHPPLTESAQRALDWAVEEKLKSAESGEITTAHLALGVWSEKESAGHKILAALGFDDDKAKALVENMDKELSFK